jgi:hypothetical protein
VDTPGDQLAAMDIFTVDPLSGAVTNVDASCACDCSQPPESSEQDCREQPVATTEDKKTPKTGCLICGAILEYLQTSEQRTCARCGEEKTANATCINGHFICDACHVQTPQEIIQRTCLGSGETDMIALLQEIRRADPFPMHGPEHHILVPAVILTTYRNLGGGIDDAMIEQAIARGNMVPGGACGFMGVCGAATGVGIGFSLLLEASPLTPNPRQKVQQLVADILTEISRHKAARCCQRECFIALTRVAQVSGDFLPIQLKAETTAACEQFHHNRECIRKACPYYKGDKDIYPESSKVVFPMANMN